MAYREEVEALKREVERLTSENAALRSERRGKLWAKVRGALVWGGAILAGVAVVGFLSLSARGCTNTACRPVAEREALVFVERTRGIARGTATTYCGHPYSNTYKCFVTPHGGATIRVDCEVTATWDVDGCTPHREP